MGTYDFQKVLTDYANGRMEVERAMGHSLQHISKLYEAQATANTDHRELRKRVDRLADDMKTLQAKIDRLQTLENGLTALNLTVYNLKADVDSLIAHTGMPPQISGKQQPPQTS